VAKSQQVYAMSDWWAGNDASGRDTPRISVPTLIADGADDSIDPVPNDRVLASIISGSRLTLYPDAGHAFLFQDWSSFAAEVDQFLAAA
jgi:pimeloyl-ACP methyl ester carboxylesterase